MTVLRFPTKLRKINTKFFSEEDHVQAQIVEYVDWQYPHILYMHVPNEGRGKISFTQMNKIKALGVKRGVLDLFFFDPRQGFVGLVMEVKSAKGKVSKEQRNWMCNLKARGWLTVVVNSFDAAKQYLDDYYKNEK